MPRSKCSSAACDSFAALRRPKTGDALCKECFFWAFETEVHHTIVTNGLFKRGNKVNKANLGDALIEDGSCNC